MVLYEKMREKKNLAQKVEECGGVEYQEVPGGERVIVII